MQYLWPIGDWYGCVSGVGCGTAMPTIRKRAHDAALNATKCQLHIVMVSFYDFWVGTFAVMTIELAPFFFFLYRDDTRQIFYAIPDSFFGLPFIRRFLMCAIRAVENTWDCVHSKSLYFKCNPAVNQLSSIALQCLLKANRRAHWVSGFHVLMVAKRKI